MTQFPFTLIPVNSRLHPWQNRGYAVRVRRYQLGVIFTYTRLRCTDAPTGRLRSQTFMVSKQTSAFSYWVQEDSGYFLFVTVLHAIGWRIGLDIWCHLSGFQECRVLYQMLVLGIMVGSWAVVSSERSINVPKSTRREKRISSGSTKEAEPHVR